MEALGAEAAEEREEPEDRSEPPSPSFVTTLALQQAEDKGEEARDLLREQARVLRLQAEHLHEQREVQLSHLKARRISEWMKVALQGLTGLVGAGVVVMILAMVAGALRSHAVVVEAFDAPPALAARGETGTVVANGLLDALRRLQAATRASAAKHQLASAWAGDIKVEAPGTGVSIGELRRLLYASLGHDLKVSGDLVQAADGGLVLTVRADGVMSKTFAGGAGELGKLTDAAAEYVYGEVDPYLLANYLSSAGRTTDTLTFLAKAYPKSAPSIRPDLLNQWGNALFGLGRLDEAAMKYRSAVEIRPDFWKAWGNLVLALEGAQGEEAAFRAGREMEQAKRIRGRESAEPTSRDAMDTLVQDWSRDYDDLTWDVRTHGSAGTSSTAAAADLAAVEAERHDWNAAERDLNASDPDDASTVMTRALVEARRALEFNNPAAAAAQLEPALAKYDADVSIRTTFPLVPCQLGLAYARKGQVAQGLALLERGGRWVGCYAFKGDALALAGDWPRALGAYKAAIALAPDLPFPYHRLGLALLARGELEQAEQQFAAASVRAPHWADPLKFWGDALAKEGRRPLAARKYAQAARYAPHWGELVEQKTRLAAATAAPAR